MDAADSSRVMWLSGPAGGGKTAIMKTIAERSANRSVKTVNFFFFRKDSTRNSSQPIISTLLYQLFQLYPEFPDAIAKIFTAHPRILDTSIAEQCKLISALSPMIRQSLPADAPIVLLVDGLDECDVDAERSQRDILRALEDLVTEDASPFRLLIASRHEAHIQMTFNQLSSHAQTIFLDEEYAPEDDIRRFVTDEFDTVKASHRNASSLKDDWPPSADIEDIVRKSSGQFIYAATVMRHISRPSTVPTLSLEQIQGIVPATNNSPLADLDSVYTFMLSRASDEDTMRNILAADILLKSLILLYSDMMTITDVLQYYDSRYRQSSVESCVSELSAIMELTPSGDLKFYHASLPDFLADQTRSGEYWLDADAFRTAFLVSLWEKPTMQHGMLYSVRILQFISE
jgi:hypothetical protein